MAAFIRVTLGEILYQQKQQLIMYLFLLIKFYNQYQYFKELICKIKLFKIARLSALIGFSFISNPTSFAQKPILIEFGWDYPDVKQLYNRLDSMQNTPFDGICFSFQNRIMEAFETELHKDSFFEFDKLKNLKWGKYTDNYVILRGFSKTGGNWFDDKAWIKIAKNMNGLSKAILTGNLKGVLFDAEYYYDDKFYDPWTYSKNQYPNLSFKDVQNQVRQRGKEFINALQLYTVDFSFLSLWVSSLLIEDKKLGPLEGTRHALLLPFIEGILSEKNKKVKIIDGNEYAYWYTKPSQFLDANCYLIKNTVALMHTAKGEKLATKIELAQPIFYDGLLARHTNFEKGIPHFEKWNWLEENLKYAISTSSSNTVWFYSERLNWWKDKVNDTLVNILQNSKTAFVSNTQSKASGTNKPIQPKCKNVNTGDGYYYIIDSKSPMKTAGLAFTYTWDNNTKQLQINYLDEIPISVLVYENNIKSKTIFPKSIRSLIKFKTNIKRRFAILANYKNGKEACGLNGY